MHTEARKLIGLARGLWGGDYFFVVLLCWLELGWRYVSNSPAAARAYDYDGHVAYTHLIALTHRLPSPQAGWETYHPPLYYLINAFVDPFGPNHVLYVRLLSLVYGLVFLSCLRWILKAVGIRPLARTLTMLYVMTTGGFVMAIFTNYSNDSLATALGALIVTLSVAAWRQWTPRVGLFLLAAVTAGLYTKLTVAFVLGACGAILLYLFLRRQSSPQDKAGAGRMIGIYALGVLLFLPWTALHNHRLSGEYLPNNFQGLSQKMSLPGGAWRFTLTPPGLTSGEWNTPFLLEEPASPRPDHENVNNKHNYASIYLATSLFSGNEYPENLHRLAWLILWLRITVTLMLGRILWRDSTSRLATAFIVLLSLIQMAYVAYSPYWSSADFRYIATTWLAWGVLWGSALSRAEQDRDRRLRILLPLVLVAGTVLQLFFVLKVSLIP